MTYFGFLIRFLIIPILLFGIVTILDNRNRRTIPTEFSATPFWMAVGLHMFIALAYTTLWDNYLVATRVWWYDPALVTGITIGYVPIEEYTFFVLQPLMAGLWLGILLRRMRMPTVPAPLKARNRWIPLGILGIIWLVSLILLIYGGAEWTYITLELVWALPPIALQIAFGGDILTRYNRLVLLSILPLTLYLSAMDAIAINAGTWTINPDKSLNLLIGGVLPLEEFLFFLITNTLVTLGVVLFVAQESWLRFRKIGEWIRGLRARNFRSIKE